MSLLSQLHLFINSRRGLLLFGVYLTIIAGGLPECFAQQSQPQPQRVDCSNATLKNTNYPYDEWLDESDKDVIDKMARNACELMQTNKYSQEEVENKFYYSMKRFSLCRQAGLNPAVEKVLKKADIPEADVNVVTKFCYDTWDFVNKKSTNLNSKEFRWLWVEDFCVSTRYAVDPPGLLGTMVPDTPSYNRFRKKTEDLCSSLRKSDTMSVDDAWFQWKQELLWVKNHATTDAAAEVGSVLGSITHAIPRFLKKLK